MKKLEEGERREEMGGIASWRIRKWEQREEYENEEIWRQIVFFFKFVLIINDVNTVSFTDNPLFN